MSERNRIAEIVAEFNEDRELIGERVALENLARALARTEAHERSAGAIDVDVLEDAMAEVALNADPNNGTHVHWSDAGMVAAEYARLLEAAPSSSALPSLDVEPEEEEGDDEGDIETFSPPRPQWPVPPTDGEDE